MSTIIEQARTLAGYETSSQLLQLRDQDWVLGRARIQPRRLLDLGCGIGSLLQGAVERWPSLEQVWGIERSQLRLDLAREQLRHAPAEVVLQQGDLLDLPTLEQRFDLISMTAVLHWLYPHEDQLFQWVARHLDEQGVFLFTSHHPVSPQGLGGEDEVVGEALLAMKLVTPGHVQAHFAEAAVLPMGTRTRSRVALEALVQRHFQVRSIASRSAALRIHSIEEYQRFHAATFGTYFSPLVPPERIEEFFARLGAIAKQRMARQGHVTDIPVSVWRCVRRAEKSGA